MRTRGLAVILSTLALISVSGAQAPAPGVAVDPRPVAVASPTPMPAMPAEAPWLRVDEAKRQYYVYKSFALPDLATRLERPVTHLGYRTLLSRRAAALRSGSRLLRLTINPRSIVDVGSADPGDAGTIAAINLEKSPELLSSVRNELRIDMQKNYVMPFLSSLYTPAQAGSGYVAHDEIIVSVVPMDLSQVSVWKLSDGRWQRAYHATAAAAPSADRRRELQKLQDPLLERTFESYVAVAEKTTGPAISSVTLTQLQTLKNQAAQKKESEVTPPPDPDPTYTAYGRSGPCHHYCSASKCNACCSNIKTAAEHSITLLAIACHLASDLCPWCHFGCAGNTAMLVSVSTSQYSSCIGNCSGAYEAPAASNPRQCPVH